MNYEELQNSNIPLITLDLIDYSIKVFTYLKDRIKDCNIKDEDLVDLSFFLSVLIGDRFYGTKEILSNYEISEYSVGNYFNIGIGPLVLYCNDQAIDLENTYDKFFKDYFDNLIKDDNKIDTLYPENIIINNLENFFVDNFLYSYVNFNSEKETELVNSLKEMSKKRLDNKDNGITYNRLNSNYLPFETSVMIRNALKWYNLLFINHKYNYNSVDIHNETEKVYLCLFLTILDIPYYEASKQCLNYLSKHNITRKNILKFYNIKEEYLDEMLEYNDEDLEKVYNSVMRKELDKMFFGTWNVGKVYKDILAETILKYVIESDVVFCFFSDHFLFKSNLNELYSIINKLPQNKKYKSNFFNVNNYSNNNNINSFNKDYSELEKYGYFLDEEEYISNPAIGREEEIKNIIITLLKPNKSSILVGDAGVGKTAVVEGLAYLIKNNKVPDKLKNMKIISITTSSLLAGSTLRGEFEEKVEKILKFLMNHKEVILFIDEIHSIVGAGTAKEQTLDFSNILKPYLDRGKIKIIGSTTENEYNELITDSALRRRFEKTIIKELDNDKIKKIVYSEIKKLEKVYNISFDFNDIETNYIINILVELTNDKNKVYNDKVNNPDLILSILSDFFASASYNNRYKVDLNDIKFAILRCDRLYDSVRKREVEKLSGLNKKIEVKSKVLKFYPNKS